MYHCTYWMPEVESFALMPSLYAGLRMSFQPFGASPGFTLLLLYAIPAKVLPVQKNEPTGSLRNSGL